jgi:predicted DNA binding CopG/RHH family protein
MKAAKLPKMDSIQELAKFWDTHDVTDFQDELKEVAEPVFAADDSIHLQLRAKEAKAVRRLAEAKGVSQAELVHEWMLERLASGKRGNQ